MGKTNIYSSFNRIIGAFHMVNIVWPKYSCKKKLDSCFFATIWRWEVVVVNFAWGSLILLFDKKMLCWTLMVYYVELCDWWGLCFIQFSKWCIIILIIRMTHSQKCPAPVSCSCEMDMEVSIDGERTLFHFFYIRN